MPIILKGPYKHRSGLRYRIQAGPGKTLWGAVGATEHEARLLAEAKIEGIQQQVDLTIGGLCELYLERLRAKGCKPKTIQATRAKLRLLLGGCEHLEIMSMTARRAKAAYQAAAASGAAAASHHKALDHARSVWAWAIRQGMAKQNPWLDVERLGRANRGKPQLRIDEARKLIDCCLRCALADDGALAVLLCLLMGLRVSEVSKRVVRDVDDDCTLLVVEDAKSKNGERRPEIPAVLQPAIRLRCQGRAPTAPLLRTATGARLYEAFVRLATHKYARLAGVPVVTPHGLRGGFASALVEAGALTHLVAAVMGHGSFEAVTAKHYATEESLTKAKDDRRRRHLRLM